MLSALSQTLVFALIPELPNILKVSATAASWAVTITILTGAVATPVVSRLADKVGKRRMIVISLVLMTIGSLLVALGGSFATVVVGRGLQGLVISTIPVGISIMRDELPREKVGFAVALMSATLGIGGAMGLPLSGLLYAHLGFASIFWVAAAGGLLLTVAVLVFVPESTVRTPGRFDYVGAVLISIALTALLLAVSKTSDWGWDSSQWLGLTLVGVVVLVAWVPYELRVKEPMVDLRTAAQRPVVLTNGASLFVAFVFSVNMLASGQQLQMPVSSGYGFGLSVSAAGLAITPAGLAMLLLSPLSARMLNRLGGRFTLLVGAAIMSGAYVYRVFATGSLAEVIVGSTLVGIGSALAFAAMPMLIMANVPITKSAASNGLNSLMRLVGAAFASAVLPAILASVRVTAGRHTFPSLSAFQAIYWISGAASLLGFFLAAFIPTSRDRVSVVGTDSGAARETVVRGRVFFGGPTGPRQPAIVTVSRLDGEPVDWARTDHDGEYAVALPGSGHYVFVANARGWAPEAKILDFQNGATDHHVLLTEQLALTGSVVGPGGPAPCAPVILHGGGGDFVGTTRTDDDGRFNFSLPQAGAYVVTAVAPDGRCVRAEKVVVSALASRVDIEIPC
jgi:MFS family permease